MTTTKDDSLDDLSQSVLQDVDDYIQQYKKKTTSIKAKEQKKQVIWDTLEQMTVNSPLREASPIKIDETTTRPFKTHSSTTMTNTNVPLTLQTPTLQFNSHSNHHVHGSVSPLHKLLIKSELDQLVKLLDDDPPPSSSIPKHYTDACDMVHRLQTLYKQLHDWETKLSSREASFREQLHKENLDILKDLEARKQSLSLLEQKLRKRERHLNDSSQPQTQQEVDELQRRLKVQSKVLSDQSKSLSDQSTIIDKQSKSLDEQLKMIDEQSKSLLKKNELIEDQANQLDRLRASKHQLEESSKKQLLEKDRAYDALFDKYKRLQDDEPSLRRQKEFLLNERSSLEEEKKQVARHSNQLDARFHDMEQQLSLRTKDLDARIDTFQSQEARRLSRLKQMRDREEAINERVAEWERACVAKMRSFERREAELNKKELIMTNKLETLQHHADTLEREVAQFEQKKASFFDVSSTTPPTPKLSMPLTIFQQQQQWSRESP